MRQSLFLILVGSEKVYTIYMKAERLRNNPWEFPTHEELVALLAHEAQRSLPKGKESVHYADFSTIVDLFDDASIPSDFFTDTSLTFDACKDPAYFNVVSRMFENLSEHIANSYGDKKKSQLLNRLYKYLSEEDVPESSDIIFVFGSRGIVRIDTAIRLFHEGYAPRIMISGRCPFYNMSDELISEAERLAVYAVEKGVPQHALLLETDSITIPDNVKRSLNLLEQKNIPYQRMLLVNSPFSQRRGYGHFCKMTDDTMIFRRVNTDVISSEYSKDEWYKNDIGRRVILKEFFSLRISELLNTS